MSDFYEPELGQWAFGQPSQQFSVPPIMDAALEAIRAEVERVVGNLRQKEFDPFGNRGESFQCEAFTAVSYSWGDEEQPWNFKHHKTETAISWYKYLGRGMSANRKISPELASDILGDCLAACRAVEKGAPWSEPGLYPVVLAPQDQGRGER